MKKEIRTGIFQYDVLWEDIPGNYILIERQVQSMHSLPELLILPELFTTGFSNNPNTLDRKLLASHCEWQLEFSRKYQLHLMGSVIFFADGKFYNRLIHTTPQGEKNTYDKRHLFQMGYENKNFSSGVHRKVFDMNGLRIMPQICYDLRFPVWSRNDLGYHLLIYSSNWPLDRKLVWDTLLRARAIENQCYVIGVNRLGTDNNGIEYFGGSSIYGPQGELILMLEKNQEYGEVLLSIDELEKYRQSFPAFKDADLFEIKNRE
jgi:omega-amidase